MIKKQRGNAENNTNLNFFNINNNDLLWSCRCYYLFLLLVMVTASGESMVDSDD